MRQRVLVWCRRFRPSYGRQFRFHLALAEACSGIAYPITIQDSSYSSSLMGSFTGRGWFVLPGAFVFFIIVLLASTMFSVTLPEPLGPQAASVGSALVAIGTAIVALRAYRRLGYRVFRGSQARDQVRAELEAIKSGRRGSTMGVDVWQCEDAVWRDVVAEALRSAEVAIVDVSDLSENLRWEADTAIAALSPSRVLLVYVEGAELSPELWSRFSNRVPSTTTRENTPAIEPAVLIYPAERAGVGPQRRRQVRDVTERLRVAIADCVFRG